MDYNSLILLILVSFVFLIITILLIIRAFIGILREGSNELIILFIILAVLIIFLLPLIIAILQEL
jgi:hypothetical protein